VKFWIAGDGKLRSALEASESSIRFLGDVKPEDMPAVMNCIDVLVLPSLNEGLGMVCAEALRCGANAVGSAVGGIAEVIGDDNVVPLGEGFARAMAEKIVRMLTSEVSQKLPADIDWNRTASLELSELLGE
jgi:glycosyltransferase involved in cell wall biosynthesis